MTKPTIDELRAKQAGIEEKAEQKRIRRSHALAYIHERIVGDYALRQFAPELDAAVQEVADDLLEEIDLPLEPVGVGPTCPECSARDVGMYEEGGGFYLGCGSCGELAVVTEDGIYKWRQKEAT